MARKKNSDPPAQTHSDTSVEAAEKVSKRRLLGQERWVYETLRRRPMADWQLWDLAEKLPALFEQATSLHRARIRLKWVNRKTGATPWHPVEDSGTRIKGKYTRPTAVWRIKEAYADMPYEEWAKNFRAMAGGKVDPAMSELLREHA